MSLEREVSNFKVTSFFPKRNKYALLIPTWNEGERIRTQLTRIQTAGIDKQIDIFLLDGRTTDGSTADEFIKKVGVRGILFIEGKGQGTAYRAGFAHVLNEGYEGIISVDGNNKESVEDIPNFIQELDAGYDFVQGSRFMKGGQHANTPLARLLGIKLVINPVVSFCAGFWYTETTSSFRGISRRFLASDELDIFRNIFQSWELLWYMAAKAPKMGLKVKEIPIKRIYPKNEPIPTKITMGGNFKILQQMLYLFLGRYESKRNK